MKPMKRTLSVTFILLLFFAATLAHALQAPEVELGNGGSYDGTVKIRRDTQGRLTLSDNQVTDPVCLNDLRYAGRDHGLLLGLADDDHPQYLTTARHDTAARHPLGSVVPHDFLEGLANVGINTKQAGDYLKWSGTAWINAALNPAAVGLGAVENIALSAWAGSANLTTLGNISAGTWNATPIAPAKGGTGLAALGSASQVLRTNAAASAAEWATLNQAAVAGLTSADAPAFQGATLTHNFDASGGGWGAPILLLSNQLTGNPNSNAILQLQTYFDGGGDPFISFNINGANGWAMGVDNSTANDDFCLGAHISGFDSSKLFTWQKSGYYGIGTATPQAPLHVIGDVTATGGLYTGGSAAAKGTLRLSGTGAATLTQASVDNLTLDGNTLSSTDANGDINLTPNGSGKVAVSGDLAVGSASAKITLNGQRFMNENNLLDNPDFSIWQRNTSQTCAAGGNSAGTINGPVPGTLATGADRWQVSRVKTDMSSVISRATPPASLTTAQYCLRNDYSGGTTCEQFIHQTLTREQTFALRGKWVTFAVSHYATASTGAVVGIYKVVSGTPTPLATFPFTATSGAWDRVAVAAQVSTDAEVLLVSVKTTLSNAGVRTAFIANAVLVEGKYVNGSEKVGDPAISSVPPLPRRPADDLACCQRYFEKGKLAYTGYSPDDASYVYYIQVHFNTAKASSTMINISNLSSVALADADTGCNETPPYTPGQTWPQGFLFTIDGSTSDPGAVNIGADWTAACPEPI